MSPFRSKVSTNEKTLKSGRMFDFKLCEYVGVLILNTINNEVIVWVFADPSK